MRTRFNDSSIMSMKVLIVGTLTMICFSVDVGALSCPHFSNSQLIKCINESAGSIGCVKPNVVNITTATYGGQFHMNCLTIDLTSNISALCKGNNTCHLVAPDLILNDGENCRKTHVLVIKYGCMYLKPDSTTTTLYSTKEKVTQSTYHSTDNLNLQRHTAEIHLTPQNITVPSEKQKVPKEIIIGAVIGSSCALGCILSGVFIWRQCIRKGKISDQPSEFQHNPNRSYQQHPPIQTHEMKCTK